jgi:hypothetical protein
VRRYILRRRISPAYEIAILNLSEGNNPIVDPQSRFIIASTRLKTG